MWTSLPPPPSQPGWGAVVEPRPSASIAARPWKAMLPSVVADLAPAAVPLDEEELEVLWEALS